MMTITSHKDVDALTMTIVATFDADVARVWQIWEDPRQVERWWGPPGYPATFVTHSLVPDASTHYYMTSPEGEKLHGWWTITSVEAPHSLELDEGFADERGNPVDAHGAAHMAITLEGEGEQTRMTLQTRFANVDQLQEMLEMGMEEGLLEAIGQVDALLVA